MTINRSAGDSVRRNPASSPLSNLLQIVLVSGRDRSAELAQFAAVGISLLVLASCGDDLFVNIDSSSLVFLDWVLPCVSTLEICRRIKCREGMEDVHVTVMIEQDDDMRRRQALRAGADDYLVGKSSLPEIVGRARTTGFCLETERLRLFGA